ncbi:hypothetical protein FQN51_002789 [Onygenales sp. PD_10]|nr:hypothetical protein FQN51_002789 [Onygenales sp. PD_10]
MRSSIQEQVFLVLAKVRVLEITKTVDEPHHLETGRLPEESEAITDHTQIYDPIELQNPFLTRLADGAKTSVAPARVDTVSSHGVPDSSAESRTMTEDFASVDRQQRGD